MASWLTMHLAATAAGQTTGHSGQAAEGAVRSTAFEVRPLQVDQANNAESLGISYGPYREGQQPGGPELPTDAQLKEDLHILARHWSLVRLYGSEEFADRLLKLIQQEKLPLRVMLGAWLGSETLPAAVGQPAAPDRAGIEANRRELAAAIRLAAAFPEIVFAVSVGNETQVDWSEHRLNTRRLVQYLRMVRGAVRVPVTTADDLGYWLTPESRALSAECDFVLCNIHPLWQGQQLDGAIDFVDDRYLQLQNLHADREIVIGEIGWATQYHAEGLQGELIQGTPGEAQQREFYEALQPWVSDRGVLTFWFEAFDEPWKGGPHPDHVEKHWGLFRVDRTPKAAMADRHNP